MSPTGSDSPSEAGPRARRQLGRVLTILGVLDLSVVVWVLAIALSAHALGFNNLELLVAILAGVGTILVLRIWLAIRLRRRAGNLS
jgi:hypothetical protein